MKGGESRAEADRGRALEGYASSLVNLARLLARMAAREAFASAPQDIPENDDAAPRPRR
jgi:hypothetical protein